MTETVSLKLSDFDYDLPASQIASEPLQDRTSAKLMCVRREDASCSDRQFRNLKEFLCSGDVLVLNDVRVIPARLLGRRETGGEAEILLVRRESDAVWQCLLRPGGKVKQGARIIFGTDKEDSVLTVLDDPRKNSAERRIRIDARDPLAAIRKFGHVPLPPYIKRSDSASDFENYQTVYAEKPGAVAAPTAGLHFDAALLQTLKDQGVQIVTLTLFVSYGTFQPVTCEFLSDHRMFEEDYEISGTAAERINSAKAANRRIVACGTTTLRALESAAGEDGRVRPGPGATKLFIYPPYRFRVVDALITNFHLPKSSLLMLVAAFLGRDRPPAESAETLTGCYRRAIHANYRFYSYGDAMFLY